MRISKTVGAVLGVLGALSSAGCGGDSAPVGAAAEAASWREEALPPLPSPALAVPAGNALAFTFDATGVQIYACKATATGFAWGFVAPQATLYHKGKFAGTHYAGPTWEYKDGSKVVGAKIAAATPDPASIPWLLLAAVSHEGEGRMDDVTYIQRLETNGGIAPSGGCDATTVGATADVPYTATYFFYRADDEGSGADD